MLLKLSYTNDTKYNSYAYLRRYRTASEDIRNGGIGETISQKPFDHKIYQNDELRLDGIYEVHPNMYLTLSLAYNHAKGFDNTKTDAIASEDIGNAQHYLDKYMPLYYQGRNFTVSAAFSFGF
jgi:hypothetical protein